MKKFHYGHCLIGIAAVLVVLVAFGTPAATLGLLAVMVACPLMMFVMMRAMMGDNRHRASDEPIDQGDHQHQ